MLQQAATYSINVISELFEDRLMTDKSQTVASKVSRLKSLKPCQFYAWENLKDKVFSNNCHIG
jgi:hypothetical protein